MPELGVETTTRADSNMANSFAEKEVIKAWSRAEGQCECMRGHADMVYCHMDPSSHGGIAETTSQ
jgi:hypothetical protein